MQSHKTGNGNKLEIVIPISKIGCHNPEFLVDTSVSPVIYRGYEIHFVNDSTFWHIIIHEGKLYTFDIRVALRLMKLEDVEDHTWEIINNREEWFQEIITKIENSVYFINIEKSLNNAVTPS